MGDRWNRSRVSDEVRSAILLGRGSGGCGDRRESHGKSNRHQLLAEAGRDDRRQGQHSRRRIRVRGFGLFVHARRRLSVHGDRLRGELHVFGRGSRSRISGPDRELGQSLASLRDRPRQHDRHVSGVGGRLANRFVWPEFRWDDRGPDPGHRKGSRRRGGYDDSDPRHHGDDERRRSTLPARPQQLELPGERGRRQLRDRRDPAGPSIHSEPVHSEHERRTTTTTRRPPKPSSTSRRK